MLEFIIEKDLDSLCLSYAMIAGPFSALYFVVSKLGSRCPTFITTNSWREAQEQVYQELWIQTKYT